jgi:hypothetical protein
MNKTKTEEELEKGCGTEVRVYTKYKWYNKRYNLFFCGKDNYLCDDCKAELKGYKKGLLEGRMGK